LPLWNRIFLHPRHELWKRSGAPNEKGELAGERRPYEVRESDLVDAMPPSAAEEGSEARRREEDVLRPGTL